LIIYDFFYEKIEHIYDIKDFREKKGRNICVVRKGGIFIFEQKVKLG
jgi:hypothetical protein